MSKVGRRRFESLGADLTAQLDVGEQEGLIDRDELFESLADLDSKAFKRLKRENDASITARHGVLYVSTQVTDAIARATRITGRKSRDKEVRGTVEERFGLERNAVAAPRSLAELVAIVDDALPRGQRLRAVGAARGHSLGTIPANARCVSLHELDGVWPLTETQGDFGRLHVRNNVDAKRLVRVQAGAPVRTVLRELRSLKQSCANHGSGDFQSMVGAISTATHGSGAMFPSLAGFVRALTVIRVEETAAGRRAVVELIQPARKPIPPDIDPSLEGTGQCYTGRAVIQSPANGGPWVFDGVEVHPVFDATAFNATVVAFGSLGIVYSVILEVLPEFPRVRERREPFYWDQVRIGLAQAAVAPQTRHLEYQVDPYPRVPAADPDDIGDAKKPLSWDKSPDQGVYRVMANIRTLTDNPHFGGRPPAMDLGSLPVAAALIGSRINGVIKQPHKTAPAGGQATIRCSAVTAAHPYIDDLVDVLLLNLKYIGLGAEWAVPLDRTVEAVDALLALNWRTWQRIGTALAGRDEFDPYGSDLRKLIGLYDDGVPLYSPISVRFVQGEPALLAGTSRHHPGGNVKVHACLEVGLLGVPGLHEAWVPRKRHAGLRPEEPVPSDGMARDLLKELDAANAVTPAGEEWVAPKDLKRIGSRNKRARMRLYAAYERGRLRTFKEEQDAMTALGGRPHWGLWFDQNWTDVVDRWGEDTVRKWTQRYLVANPIGTFDGALTDRLGIRNWARDNL